MKKLIKKLIIVGVYALVFFLKVIPIPIENDNGDFVWGFIFTSLMYQLQVGNYFGVVVFTIAFISMLILIKLIQKRSKKE